MILTVDKGVPQGSILGPMIFTLNINIYFVTEHCNVHVHAHNTVCYATIGSTTNQACFCSASSASDDLWTTSCINLKALKTYFLNYLLTLSAEFQHDHTVLFVILFVFAPLTGSM